MTGDPSPRELQVGGAVPLDTGVYVVRRSDAELLEALQQGEYCNVLCPRQMGKTSSIMRIRAELRRTGFRTALIDLAGRLGTPANADDWYVGLLSHLSSEFDLGCNVPAWWAASVEPTANQKLLAFIRDEILARHPGVRFVAFLDEIDHTLNLRYTDDFFLAIRSLYNDRAGEPDLRRLTFCLAGVFTPNELVKQQRTTTYNVGRTFELQDFDPGRDDLSPLARALSPDPARGESLLTAVLKWTGGQPYLTASACKKMVAAGLDSPAAVDRLIDESFLTHEKPLEDSDGTHFENIERFLGQRVSARLETVNLYRRLLRGGEERDRPTPPVLALKLSGLVKIGPNARLTIRNEIYRRRFDERWTATVVPVAERWTRRVAVGIAALFLLFIGVNQLWVRPKALAQDIASTDDYQLAKGKWEELRKTLFWSGRADEVWADFFRRRAERADRADDRDASIYWRLSAMQGNDRELDRRAASSLILADYPALTNTFRHAGAVDAVAFSPNGETVVTGSGDNTARLWNVRTGAPLGPPLQHQSSVVAVAFSPNGETVVTGSGDKTARLWNARTGAPLGPPLQHEMSITAVAFNPNGETLVTGSGEMFNRSGEARLWNARTGAPLGPPLQHEGRVTAVAFSPNGETVVTGSGEMFNRSGEARLWNARTGAVLGPPLQHEGRVSAVAFSPDGETVVTGSDDNTARLWNARTGAPVGPPLQHEMYVTAVAFNPNGETLVTGSEDKTARLWNVRTGAPLGTPLQHEASVTAVAFSPNGETVVTGSEDNTARLWNARTGAPIGTPLQHEGRVTAVAFSPNGETVVTGSEDNTARLWNARTGAPIGTPLQHQSSVIAVAFSPNGETVVTGSWDKTARLWNARTGAPLGPPLQHQNTVNAVAFSPNGETVVTGSLDKTARLWNARTGAPLGPPLQHQNTVNAVAFSPNGETVVTGSGEMFNRSGEARLWNARTGAPLGTSLQHQNTVNAVAFSPNGETVVTGSEDNTARLWNARTGAPIGTPLQHQSSVIAVAFSPNGETVVTGSGDNTARLWNARTGAPLGPPLQHQGTVTAVAFSADGRRLLCQTSAWLHEYQAGPEGFRPLCSRYVGSMLPGAWQLADDQGNRIRVLTTAGEVRLRTLAFDFSDAIPLTGDPATLLPDWTTRLGLRLDSNGRLMTATDEEWIAGEGIRRAARRDKGEPQDPSAHRDAK